MCGITFLSPWRLGCPVILLLTPAFAVVAQDPVAPSVSEIATIESPLDDQDVISFQNPAKVFHPETWFHFIGGNVAEQGVTADIEAIANAEIECVQFFHGQSGGPWPSVDPQIKCLSESWDDAVRHVAQECQRLGLRFTMQNFPG
ncbi:hypothetical protein CA13_30370 [Planctomycetes bacterium CA13]|uniref:Uncharacterized protein n=1 Tax=Novipirellula herctigrandis TaxID=2527986 RepID=A0A5C5Z2U5_9BACT|nr:hypothetical protein CA13_30370 [Planctomycetes bacterium CA13]